MIAGTYPKPRPVDEVLELVGLEDKAGPARPLSGGQQRRLDVALALVGDPDLLFLDEPTTGFDPDARREAWAMVARAADLGKTVLLTTHYMDEAQHARRPRRGDRAGGSSPGHAGRAGRRRARPAGSASACPTASPSRRARRRRAAS